MPSRPMVIPYRAPPAGAAPDRIRVLPLPFHLTIGWALVLVTLYYVGFVVPPAEVKLGSSYLIFFFHFPSAINCLNLFFFGGLGSVGSLTTVAE